MEPSTASPATTPTTPAPARVIYMRCTENRVEDDHDGGLVLFQVIAGQQSDDYADGRLVLSFTHDTPMEAYPVTREQKQQRFFRVTLEEIAYSDVPPDPKAPTLPTARQLLEQALSAAVRDGDTALADAISQELAAPAVTRSVSA